MKKIIISILIFLFAFSVLAKTDEIPASGLTPDSSFYFLKAWKESIQTFFTFGVENKAKQYLHLAEVRLAEYQKMVEKGKTEIAEKTLEKYQNQLNRALQKTEELKNKGKDIKDLSQKIEDAVTKHLDVLQENLQKVPEQAKKGIENAIENSQKQIEKITGKKDETADWKTYRNEEYGFEVKYPNGWSKREEEPKWSNFYSSYPELKNIDSLLEMKFVSSDNPEKTLGITVYKNNPRYTLEEWLVKFSESTPTGIGLEWRENTTVNNESGIKGAFGCCMAFSRSFFFAEEDKIFQMEGGHINLQTGRSDYEELFNQILSTFKFISQ